MTLRRRGTLPLAVTMALCMACGATKFGALLPCAKCHSGPSGDVQLDILFTDHRFAVETLEEFGNVIRAIREVETDPPAVFWSFIAYVSRDHGELLQATPPPALAQRVAKVLEGRTFPPVVLRTSPHALARPPSAERPTQTIELDDAMFEAFRARNPFELIVAVEVRQRNGVVRAAHLIDEGVRREMVIDGGEPILADDIAALRRKPGWLPWRRNPLWVERPQSEP
jgi:hypothetical protein